MNTIKFSKQFTKLHKQTSAKLIYVNLLDAALMSNNDFEELYNYDCKADDGSFYPLNKDKTYTQLILIGNKNIPFSTLRNNNKYKYYMNCVGEIFNIEVLYD